MWFTDVTLPAVGPQGVWLIQVYTIISVKGLLTQQLTGESLQEQDWSKESADSHRM